MKSKKGFSLIEILAVILILGIVSAIAVTSYNLIKVSVLETELENTVFQIETEAENYAFDTGNVESVFYITTQTLVDNGYLTTDEDGNITNPLDGTNLNCNVITIKYVDGVYVATFDSDNEAENCEIETVYNSGISVDGTYEIVNGSKWYYGDDITLFYEALEGEIIESYFWSNNLGGSGEEETFVINTNGTINTTYYLNVIFSEDSIVPNSVKNLSIILNVDNGEPNINNVTTELGWTNEDKLITISSTDLSGSGIKDYYYSNSINGSYELYDDSVDFGNGTYYIYAEDYCGNKGDVFEYQISNIDKEDPIIENIDIITEDAKYLTIDAADSNSGIKGYILTKSSTEPTSGFTSGISISAAGTYYLWVSDIAGNVVGEQITIVSYTYIYNNGDNNKTVYYLKDGTTFGLEEPTKTNYNFDGWYLNGSEINSNIFSSLSGDNTFTAEYNYEDIDITVLKYNEEKMDIISKIHLIFVIDKSSSMSTAEMSTVKGAVSYIMNNTEFSADSIFSIISFNSSATYNLKYSNNTSTVISTVNSISSSGSTDFEEALEDTTYLAKGTCSGCSLPSGFDESNTYVIFLSDGISSISTSTLTSLKSSINSIYTVGIGVSSSSAATLKTIASSTDHYYSYSTTTDVQSLIDIFESITEEIAENEQIRTTDGKYELPNLVITSSTPFTLEIGSKTYTFTSITQLNSLLSYINGTYYLNLAYIDEYYGLNGVITSVKLTYYYN